MTYEKKVELKYKSPLINSVHFGTMTKGVPWGGHPNHFLQPIFVVCI